MYPIMHTMLAEAGLSAPVVTSLMVVPNHGFSIVVCGRQTTAQDESWPVNPDAPEDPVSGQKGRGPYIIVPEDLAVTTSTLMGIQILLEHAAACRIRNEHHNIARDWEQIDAQIKKLNDDAAPVPGATPLSSAMFKKMFNTLLPPRACAE